MRAKWSEDKKISRMVLERSAAPYIYGRDGSTLNKIGIAAQCDVYMREGDIEVDIGGEDDHREAAEMYIRFVTRQRLGPIKITKEEMQSCPHITLVRVPPNLKGFIVGVKAKTLRILESTTATLMFFASIEDEDDSPNDDDDYLFILSTDFMRRRMAEMACISLIESKAPGTFSLAASGSTIDDREGYAELRQSELIRKYENDDPPEWGTELVHCPPGTIQYLMGSNGRSKRKIAIAADVALEYIRNTAIICGFPNNRRLAKKMISGMITLQTRNTTMATMDLAGEKNLTIVKLPKKLASITAGKGGVRLREMERVSRTYIFLNPHREPDNAETLWMEATPLETTMLQENETLPYFDLCILASKEESRESAVDKVEGICKFHGFELRRSSRGEDDRNMEVDDRPRE